MAGDCYQANGNFIIEKMGDKQFKLCHGVALLASDRKPYGHCWIEKGSMVMDFSNGKKFGPLSLSPKTPDGSNWGSSSNANNWCSVLLMLLQQ